MMNLWMEVLSNYLIPTLSKILFSYIIQESIFVYHPFKIICLQTLLCGVSRITCSINCLVLFSMACWLEAPPVTAW